MNKASHLKKLRGGIMIMMALMLFAFLAFTALSVDLGHVFVVQNELQNAADAAALQGAGYLHPTISGVPNWSLASSSASGAVQQNKVDNVNLSTGSVTTGYWSLTNAVLQSTNITPGATDVPAVQVTISKSSGVNGGPVNLFFGTVLGLPTVNLHAIATAATGSPNQVNGQTLFPIAMSKTTYDTYWNSASNTPIIDPSTGKPYVFHISEGVQGGWTSFETTSNDTTSLINLMNNGNSTPLKIGDSIWMTTGIKTAAYSSVPTNKNVLIPIVANSSPGAFQTIVAFGVVHIDFGVGASSKYVQLELTYDYKLSGGGTPGGPSYGVFIPPKLVQ